MSGSAEVAKALGLSGLANGHASAVPPSFDAALDLEADTSAEPDVVAPTSQPLFVPEPDQEKIWFVRVPRPAVAAPSGPHDEGLKALQAEFQNHVTKIKGINARLGAKRDEARELRRQMGVGRSLKESSQPEYEEKLGRLQLLRGARNAYQSRNKDFKEATRGLECRTEEELDARIRELESRIQHDGVSLREEKEIVKLISKIRSQRQQVRELDGQKGDLAGLAGEADKVKAQIEELEAEFTILKAERDQAQKIISDIYAKLQVAEKELKDLEEEQAEAVKGKNDALAALDKARSDMNDTMADYRENRSFSLKVRDLVAAGHFDTARQAAAAQVDALIAKLSSDASYRKEYESLWAAQRKFAISELLPSSSTAAQAAAASGQPTAGGRGRGPSGGRGGASERVAPVPPPKPQGAEKAKLLIESLMKEAQQEAAGGRGSRGTARAYELDSDDDHTDDTLAPLPTRSTAAADAAPAGAYKPSISREVVGGDGLPAPTVRLPPKASEAYKVEMPVILSEVEFVLPASARSEEVVSADKDKVREEQRAKAAEAEARKRKKLELSEKKKVKAVEAKKKEVEVGREKRAAAAAGPSAAELAEAAAAAASEAAAATAADSGTESAPAVISGSYKLSAAPKEMRPDLIPIAKSQVAVAAKRGPRVEPLPKKLRRFWKQNTALLAGGGIVLLLAVLLVLYLAFN